MLQGLTVLDKLCCPGATKGIGYRSRTKIFHEFARNKASGPAHKARQFNQGQINTVAGSQDRAQRLICDISILLGLTDANNELGEDGSLSRSRSCILACYAAVHGQWSLMFSWHIGHGQIGIFASKVCSRQGREHASHWRIFD